MQCNFLLLLQNQTVMAMMQHYFLLQNPTVMAMMQRYSLLQNQTVMARRQKWSKWSQKKNRTMSEKQQLLLVTVNRIWTRETVHIH
jgi:hypothetical protein